MSTLTDIGRERVVLGTEVAQLARDYGVTTLERRRMALGRGVIDVLAVGPGGVTIVSALLLRGRMLVARGDERAPADRFLIGGRDHSPAVHQVERQVHAVRHALAVSGPDMPPVLGALCTPNAWLLPACERLVVRDVVVDDPTAVSRLIARPGRIAPARIARIVKRLERAFPAVLSARLV